MIVKLRRTEGVRLITDKSSFIKDSYRNVEVGWVGSLSEGKASMNETKCLISIYET